MGFFFATKNDVNVKIKNLQGDSATVYSAVSIDTAKGV
jgi:hypothetical protein